MPWIPIVLIGAGAGFLGGLFGKGGSAVATPLLALVGVPAIIAVAAPLPATIPGTLVAAVPYAKRRHFDREVFRDGLVLAMLATIAGAISSRWVGGAALVRVTDVVIAGLGLRFAMGASTAAAEREVSHRKARIVFVSLAVGFAAGLLANSGGFLLAPLYMAVLHMPVRRAFGTSLLLSAVLALPGTIVHTALGHIDWRVVGVFGVASVPLSFLGARLALRTRPERLERIYGAALLVLGVSLFFLR